LLMYAVIFRLGRLEVSAVQQRVNEWLKNWCIL
jgi:hypothetical protein